MRNEWRGPSSSSTMRSVGKMVAVGARMGTLMTGDAVCIMILETPLQREREGVDGILVDAISGRADEGRGTTRDRASAAFGVVPRDIGADVSGGVSDAERVEVTIGVR